MTTPPPHYGRQPTGQPPHGQPPAQGAQPGYTGYVAYPQPRPQRQPVPVWDVVLTIVFLVGLVVLTAFASFMGLFVVMASDSCGARECSTDFIVLGWLVAMLLPWVALIAAVTVSIVFMVKRKLAFYIPVLGAVGVGGALILGFVIAGAGVPTS